MKRILSLICLLAILLSTVSCSSGLEANQTAEATPAEMVRLLNVCDTEKNG